MSQKMQLIIGIGVVGAVVILLVILSIFGRGGGSSRNYYTPNELMQERSANQVAFETNFVGKQIFMKGRVEAVQSRFSSGYSITIGSGLNSVDCNVPEEFVDRLLSIKQGQRIEVRGTVEHSLFGFDLYDCLPVTRRDDIDDLARTLDSLPKITSLPHQQREYCRKLVFWVTRVEQMSARGQIPDFLLAQNNTTYIVSPLNETDQESLSFLLLHSSLYPLDRLENMRTYLLILQGARTVCYEKGLIE